MRLYYIFSIKNEIVNLYKDKPSSLYKILENIYFMHQEDLNYGFSIFKQLTKRIRKQDINDVIYYKLHKDLTYSKINEEHIINDLYHDEISILKVKNSHLLIETNKSFSGFFKLLNEINPNYFICDFKEKDFFFVSNIANFINS